MEEKIEEREWIRKNKRNPLPLQSLVSWEIPTEIINLKNALTEKNLASSLGLLSPVQLYFKVTKYY